MPLGPVPYSPQASIFFTCLRSILLRANNDNITMMDTKLNIVVESLVL
jgi:hypothetical protein